MKRVLPALLLSLAVGGPAALAPTDALARDRVRPERLVVLADVVDVRPVYRESATPSRAASAGPRRSDTSCARATPASAATVMTATAADTVRRATAGRSSAD